MRRRGRSYKYLSDDLLLGTHVEMSRFLFGSRNSFNEFIESSKIDLL